MTQNTETHPIVNLLKTVFTLTSSITFTQTEVYKLRQQRTEDQEWCYGTHLVSQNLQVTQQIEELSSAEIEICSKLSTSQ